MSKTDDNTTLDQLETLASTTTKLTVEKLVCKKVKRNELILKYKST